MRSISRIWAAPVVLALTTGVGLTAALVGDGWADTLSWLTLSIPAAAMLWYSLR